MDGHVLELVELYKTFNTSHGAVNAVDGVNLRIVGDEFFTLLGPSGCGKTTTLRMIAGLESISAGRILFENLVIEKLEPCSKILLDTGEIANVHGAIEALSCKSFLVNLPISRAIK